MPDLSAPSGESDFYFVPVEDPETAVQRILELAKTRIPKRFGLNPIRDVQVLCPMNRGGLGARSLNIELQSSIEPRRRTQGRAVRMDLYAGRQGHADRE
jgi:exodeoxyribonuclease V alpha subunit